MAGRRSDDEARATRTAILERSLDVVSFEGFEGLTLGSLASDLEMSKAGILGHFGTKEGLQLATYHEAAVIFRRAVVDPGREQHGLDRLRGYCQRWADFIGDPPWPGGCVITPAAYEYDGRPGPMADAIRQGMEWWRERLREAAAEAIDSGELPGQTDPEQVAFTIVALATGTVRARQMHQDPRAGERLKVAFDALLGI